MYMRVSSVASIFKVSEYALMTGGIDNRRGGGIGNACTKYGDATANVALVV